MDDELKLVCAEALRQLSAIPVEDRSWEKVLSEMHNTIMEPMSMMTKIDKTEFWLSDEANPLNASSSKDFAIISEVRVNTMHYA